MNRPVLAILPCLLVMCAAKPKDEYNPSQTWPRDFGTEGAGPHDKTEQAFVDLLEYQAKGQLVVDARLSAVADAVALEEIVSPERRGADLIRHRRYEGAPHVVLPELERFTMAHRAIPDAARLARELGVVQTNLGPQTLANGVTVGVGSARDGRQRHWVLIVGQGRFTMDDLARQATDDGAFTIQVPDANRVDVYWRPGADGPVGQATGKDGVKVELPAEADAVSVVATKDDGRFEVVRLQRSDYDVTSWTDDAIARDVNALREQLGQPALERIDVLPCDAQNLKTGTPLSGDRTCWVFPTPDDRTLWSELRGQPLVWADLARPDRHFFAVQTVGKDLVVQFRSRFEPIAPSKVEAAVKAHPRLDQATWVADGAKRLSERLETMRASRLAEDAARIRDEVLDARPLFQEMGRTRFAVGFGPRLDGALDMATQGLQAMPSQVAVGYRELRTKELGYLHVVAVATHEQL